MAEVRRRSERRVAIRGRATVRPGIDLRPRRRPRPGPRTIESSAARLFGPASITWRINRERLLIVGGARSLLMQIAHPLIAAGVAEHSGFREDPLGRLRRTMEFMSVILFGTAAEARRAADRLHVLHGAVRGVLRESVGDFCAGTRYRARDPELLFWVHATLVDTSLLVFRRYVRELSAAEEEQYYQESKTIARLHRIPDSMIPRRARDFRDYMDRMLDSGPIAVGDTARELAGHILAPAVPPLPALGIAITGFISVGLLPEKLRTDFGLTWGRGRQYLLDASEFASRTLLPLVPTGLRIAPAALATELGLEPASVHQHRRWMPKAET
ncbi:MAG TPA: oxygenase MpaB family protein [Candidatus Binataceae bacterium]|nr:oxygenase MpaB family protein [Candidatus Binataceae bacterium]